MTGLDSILAQHGSGLVLALSCLLGVGTLAVLLGHSPLHRQRVAELTLAAALLACGLLLLPLPRPGLSWLTAGGDEQLHAPVTGAAAAASAAMPISLPVVQQVPWEQAVPRTLGMRSELPDASLFPGAPRLLAQLFLLGAAGFAAHLLLSFVLLHRTLRKAADAPAWVKRLTSGSEPGESPRVLLANGISRPFCCGLGRGTIVLPVQLAQPALRARVEAVLAHERAHISQRHPRARLLASLVSPFLYWHPLYWWLARELRRCSELLADDMAAGRLDKRHYVAGFLELAESCSQVPAPQALGLGAFGTRKDFLIRMETLLMRRTRLSTRSSALHVATRSCCAVLLLGSVSLAWGRPPQDGLPGLEAKNEYTAKVVRHFTTAIDTMTQAEVVQDYTLQSSAIAQLPEEQPGIVATFHFVDPRALGEFFVRCYDAGLAVRMLDLGSPAPETGRRTGHASVHGVNSVSLDFLLKFGVPGLDLTLITVDGKGLPGAKLPSTPLVERLDRMRRELADLRDEIAEIDARRGDLGVNLAFKNARVDELRAALGSSVIMGNRQRNDLLVQLRNLGYASGAAESLPSAPSKRVQLVEIYLTEGNQIRGTVVSVLGGEGNLVAIDRGSSHDVHVGQTFEVYRESTYKGRVRVTTVSKDLCIGVIEMQAEGTKMEQGDKATTSL